MEQIKLARQFQGLSQKQRQNRLMIFWASIQGQPVLIKVEKSLKLIKESDFLQVSRFLFCKLENLIKGAGCFSFQQLIHILIDFQHSVDHDYLLILISPFKSYINDDHKKRLIKQNAKRSRFTDLFELSQFKRQKGQKRTKADLYQEETNEEAPVKSHRNYPKKDDFKRYPRQNQESYHHNKLNKSGYQNNFHQKADYQRTYKQPIRKPNRDAYRQQSQERSSDRFHNSSRNQKYGQQRREPRRKEFDQDKRIDSRAQYFRDQRIKQSLRQKRSNSRLKLNQKFQRQEKRRPNQSRSWSVEGLQRKRNNQRQERIHYDKDQREHDKWREERRKKEDYGEKREDRRRKDDYGEDNRGERRRKQEYRQDNQGVRSRKEEYGQEKRGVRNRKEEYGQEKRGLRNKKEEYGQEKRGVRNEEYGQEKRGVRNRKEEQEEMRVERRRRQRDRYNQEQRLKQNKKTNQVQRQRYMKKERSVKKNDPLNDSRQSRSFSTRSKANMEQQHSRRTNSRSKFQQQAVFQGKSKLQIAEECLNADQNIEIAYLKLERHNDAYLYYIDQLLIKKEQQKVNRILNKQLKLIQLDRFDCASNILSLQNNFFTVQQFDFKQDQIQLVQNIQALKKAVQFISKERLVAIDTQYFIKDAKEILSTLQIATGKKIFIIDFLTIKSAIKKTIVSTIFDSSKVMIIGHSLQNQLRVLRSNVSDQINFFNSFDSKIYATKNKVSSRKRLTDLSQKFLGRGICKLLCDTDWQRRPLLKSMLHYASMDALICLKIYESLNKEICIDKLKMLESRYISFPEEQVGNMQVFIKLRDEKPQRFHYRVLQFFGLSCKGSYRSVLITNFKPTKNQLSLKLIFCMEGVESDILIKQAIVAFFPILSQKRFCTKCHKQLIEQTIQNRKKCQHCNDGDWLKIHQGYLSQIQQLLK